MKDLYDVIIIGGGPAGASVALYACRGGLSVLVLHTADSALHKAHRIENYYGAGAVSGGELYERGLDQARSVGAEILEDQATFAQTDGETFSVATANHGEIKARRLVIATGAARQTVDIENLAALEGKGISYCAVCDAFFYRKKRVAVLGAGALAAHEYETLSRVAGEVYLLTNGAAASFDAPNTDTRRVVAAVADEAGKLCAVKFEDGETLAVDGLFIALGVMSSSTLAKSMGVFTDKSGAIVTDEKCLTNIAGLYAVGDCTAGIKQVGKAVADGVTAGMSIVSEFKKEK